MSPPPAPPLFPLSCVTNTDMTGTGGSGRRGGSLPPSLPHSAPASLPSLSLRPSQPPCLPPPLPPCPLPPCPLPPCRFSFSFPVPFLAHSLCLSFPAPPRYRNSSDGSQSRPGGPHAAARRVSPAHGSLTGTSGCTVCNQSPSRHPTIPPSPPLGFAPLPPPLLSLAHFLPRSPISSLARPFPP